MENRSHSFEPTFRINYDVELNQMDNSTVESSTIKNGIARLPEEVAIPETNIYTNAAPLAPEVLDTTQTEQNGRSVESLQISSERPIYLILPNKEVRENATKETNRTVIVSNRSSFSAIEQMNGGKKEFTCHASLGGLATGMNSALNGHEKRNLWIGWDGTKMDKNQHPMQLDEEREGLEEAFRSKSGLVDYDVVGVRLTKEEHDKYYEDIANGVLWPVCHDRMQDITDELKDPETFKDAWAMYESVNEKFATAVMETTNISDTLWVQDYHLVLLGKKVREMNGERNDQNMNFFLHIPFPKLESLLTIPEEQRYQLLEGLLNYNGTAFQTDKDVQKFITAVKHHYPEARIDAAENDTVVIDYNGRKTLVGALPISIDDKSFEEISTEEATQASTKEFKEMVEGREIFASISRLDPTKALKEAMIAYDAALKEFPELRGNISLVMAVASGRLGVPAYQKLYDAIHKHEAEMNARHLKEYGMKNSILLFDKGVRNDVIVNGQKRNNLSGLFKAGHGIMASDADGMNLTGLEYIASSPEDGQLIVGENIGLGARFNHTPFKFNNESPALLIDPNNITQYMMTIYQIATMPELERYQRNFLMHQETKQYNVFDWVELQKQFWQQGKEIQLSSK